MGNSKVPAIVRVETIDVVRRIEVTTVFSDETAVAKQERVLSEVAQTITVKERIL